MHALRHRQPDAAGERTVAGEDPAAPVRAALKRLADRRVQRPQLRFLAKPLAVGRIYDDGARRARRWSKVRPVTRLERKMIPDPRRSRIGAGEVRDIAPQVVTDDWSRQCLQYSAPRFVANLSPPLDVEVEPSLKAKALAR